MAGLAHVGTMCNRREATALTVYPADIPSFIVAIVAAHELGHNFNMLHDNIGMSIYWVNTVY